tara:strand:+ start:54 stop:263 length:210 start_codon:yes stop_codon:yes gene_type:complete
MKFIFFLTISIIVLFSLSSLVGKTNIELKVGDQAPSFELKDQDKKFHKLSDYFGQKIVLYYFPKADTPG